MNLLKIYPQFHITEKWNVRSSGDPEKLYLVEKMINGSLRCDCVAGHFKKDCRHKKVIRDKFNFVHIT